MKFKKELKFQTFVLLSKGGFNPGKFNLYWLDSNNIIKANDIKQEKSFFAPETVQAISNKLNLIVTPDQIQIAVNNASDFKSVVLENVQAMVSKMDDVKLTGLGLNFNWFILETDTKFSTLSKKFFFNNADPVAKYFDDDTAMFGTYYSKQVSDNVRLKLAVNPANMFDTTVNKTFECIHFAFNFHSDLGLDDQRKQVLDIIEDFEKWNGITEEIMNKYE